MKIAIFTDCYLDLTGGIVTTINAEKEELERRGNTVYVFSSAYPKGRAEREELAKKHIYPVPSCKVFGRGATPIARRPRVIEKWIEKEHPEVREFDIYYIHYEAGCSIAGIRLARKWGVPVAQVMHGREDMGESSLVPWGMRTCVAVMLNMFHSWYLPHSVKVAKDTNQAPTLARAKMWTLMVNHANASDVVITPSEHFARLLKEYGVMRPIEVLHHGVPDEMVERPAEVREKAEGEPLRIIWHSRVSAEKRILPFLEALKKLKHGTYRLDVYGDGVELPQAKMYAATHRLNAKFHGVVGTAEIEEALASAQLDVLVSYNYDTFGMTLIEAEARGVPVLIVDPALREILPRGGYICAQDQSPKAMAEALRGVIEKPESIREMSKVMLDHREEIRNSVKVDKLLKIFYSIISVEKCSKKSKKLMKKS